MRHILLKTSLTAALALAAYAAAPGSAQASCEGRTMTGTVIGGVGGALIGNAISHGPGGTILGGLGGAVVGHEIARSGCRRYYRRHYTSYRPRYYGSPSGPARSSAPAVYYDQYGNPVGPALTPAAAGGPPPRYLGACHTQLQSYYDDRANLVQRSVQVCAP